MSHEINLDAIEQGTLVLASNAISALIAEVRSLRQALTAVEQIARREDYTAVYDVLNDLRTEMDR